MLKSRFPEIIATLSPRVEEAIAVGVEGIAQAAKARVPVATGALRDAIHVEHGPLGWYVVAGDTRAFYGHMVEFGTVNAPAQPFLIPATEAGTEPLLAEVRAALKTL